MSDGGMEEGEGDLVERKRENKQQRTRGGREGEGVGLEAMFWFF